MSFSRYILLRAVFQTNSSQVRVENQKHTLGGVFRSKSHVPLDVDKCQGTPWSFTLTEAVPEPEPEPKPNTWSRASTIRFHVTLGVDKSEGSRHFATNHHNKIPSTSKEGSERRKSNEQFRYELEDHASTSPSRESGSELEDHGSERGLFELERERKQEFNR